MAGQMNITTCRYRELKQQLQTTVTEEGEQNWNKMITETTAQYKDPEMFWRKIKYLSGNNTLETHYILDSNNTRKYTAPEQEKVHTKL